LIGRLNAIGPWSNRLTRNALLPRLTSKAWGNDCDAVSPLRADLLLAHGLTSTACWKPIDPKLFLHGSKLLSETRDYA